MRGPRGGLYHLSATGQKVSGPAPIDPAHTGWKPHAEGGYVSNTGARLTKTGKTWVLSHKGAHHVLPPRASFDHADRMMKVGIPGRASPEN